MSFLTPGPYVLSFAQIGRISRAPGRFLANPLTGYTVPSGAVKVTSPTPLLPSQARTPDATVRGQAAPMARLLTYPRGAVDAPGRLTGADVGVDEDVGVAGGEGAADVTVTVVVTATVRAVGVPSEADLSLLLLPVEPMMMPTSRAPVPMTQPRRYQGFLLVSPAGDGSVLMRMSSTALTTGVPRQRPAGK
jgi:hypothetical protein